MCGAETTWGAETSLLVNMMKVIIWQVIGDRDLISAMCRRLCRRVTGLSCGYLDRNFRVIRKRLGTSCSSGLWYFRVASGDNKEKWNLVLATSFLKDARSHQIEVL